MALKANSISRSFGSLNAVVNLDLEVTPGQVVGLVGPNGCGKTTSMLMMAGLLQPSTGWIQIDDQVVASADKEYPSTSATRAAGRSNIGWMPDEFGSWDALECRQVLEVFAGLYDVANPRERADQMLDLMGLTAFAKHRLHTLSRGQKQRLGLARTLMHDPKYLILDEPANGMDPRARIELRRLLRDIAKAGHGILISSHILTELEDTVDDVVFMARGRRVQTRAASEQTWTMRVLNPPAWDALVASDADLAVRQIPATGDGEAGETEQTLGMDVVLTASGPRDIAEVLTRVCAAGVQVSHLQDNRQSLESQYLTLEGAPE